MRRLLAGMLLLATVACAGDQAGRESTLAQAAHKMREIRSGTIRVALRMAPAGARDEAMGFDVSGPLSVEGDGPLPVADLRYTRTTGERRRSFRFVSDGNRAYVVDGSRTHPVSGDAAAALREATAEMRAHGGLGRLRIDRWATDVTEARGPTVDGVATTAVRGRLDVPVALADVFELARRFGAGGSGTPLRIDEREARRLRRATQSSSFAAFVGSDDRLLRRVDADVVLGADVPDRLRRALGATGGLRIDLRLSIQDVNEPVRVRAPIRP